MQLKQNNSNESAKSKKLSQKFLFEINKKIHDFRNCEWGWNITHITIDAEDKSKATAIIIGKGIKLGDIVFINGASENGQLLEIVDVRYESNPADMCNVKMAMFGIPDDYDFTDK